MSLSSISDKLYDLSSLCLCFLIHPLSQSLLKACLPSTSQELYLSSSQIPAPEAGSQAVERASTCRQEPVFQGEQPLPAQCCFSFLQL